MNFGVLVFGSCAFLLDGLLITGDLIYLQGKLPAHMPVLCQNVCVCGIGQCWRSCNGYEHVIGCMKAFRYNRSPQSFLSRVQAGGALLHLLATLAHVVLLK